MAGQAGRNYGVTGLIDLLPATGSPLAVPTPPVVQAEIMGFALALAGDVVEITGPGSNFAKQVYGSNVGGQMTADGNVQSVQRPFPPTMRNVKGAVTVQADANCTIALPVLIQSLTCTKNQKTSDQWRVSYVMVKNGAETISGWGAAATYSQPALVTQEIFSGSQRVTDPQALNTAYLVKYFLPISGTSDSAVNTAIDNWVAGASVPRSGLKVANTTLLRIDDAAGLLIAQWAMRDSADEWLIAHTKQSLDPKFIKDDVPLAEIFITSSPPSDPSPPLGLDGNSLKLIARVDETLTPGSTGKTGRVWNHGRNDSQDELERSLRHGTMVDLDPNTIDSNARITIVAATLPATPTSLPGGLGTVAGNSLKIVSTTCRFVTDQLFMWAFNFGPADSIDRLQFKKITIDQSDVPTESEAEVPVVNGVPSAPVSPANLILAKLEKRDLPGGNVLSTGTFTLRGTPQDILQDNGGELSLGPTIGESFEKITELISQTTGYDLRTQGQAYADSLAGTTSPVQGYPFRTLKAKRYGPNAILFTRLYQSPGFFVHLDNGAKIKITSKIGAVKGKGWLGVNATGNPSLFLQNVLSRGSSKYLSKLGQYEVIGIGGPLTVQQRTTGTAPPLGSSSLLKTNSAVFLNFPIGSVMYCSASEELVISDTTSTYDMTYNFNVFISQNWVGFPVISGIPVGGLIHGSTNVNSGTRGDWAGTSAGSGVFTWDFGGVTIRAKFPSTDSFGFTTWDQ